MTASKTSAFDRRRLLKGAAVAAALSAPATAQAQPQRSAPRPPSSQTAGRGQVMTSGGLSKARLARMHEVMGDHVARGDGVALG
jgi:hypothetical protein